MAGYVHTFYGLIPPSKYFATHPKWFSMLKGTRVHPMAQLCLTNDEMRQELVKNLKARLRASPAATIASVSQNDWYGNCQCRKCRRLDRRERSPAGTMIHFVNKVAEEIEEEFPHVAISTLAYQYTRRPPHHVKPRPNVIVQLCSIECSFSRPLDHPRNSRFAGDLVGWSKICKRLYIWDYTTNFKHHLLPHPNLRVLAPNIRFFVRSNAKGIFEQGAPATPGAEMAELRAWVLAKLLWNPELDGKKLVDEFLEGYYGAAGPHLRAYLDVIHDAVEASGDRLGCFSPHTASFLSFETLCSGWRLLAAAEEAVKGKAELLSRVHVTQLPVMYAVMMRWDEMRRRAQATGAAWPLDSSIEKTFGRFMKVAKAKKINRLTERGKGFGVLEKAVKRAKR